MKFSNIKLKAKVTISPPNF